MTPKSKDDSILIVGAGVFGLSTALELKKRGYRDVTVIDRYLPPVVDGSSVDISRVIRVDYADPLYAQMAREAHEGWTTTYRDHYYQSGFVMLAQQPGHPYIEKSNDINKKNGIPLEEYDDASQVRGPYPSIPTKLDGLKAYVNHRGGWADAEGSIRHLSMQCSLAGVTFITGPRGTAQSLRYNGDRVSGVNTVQGPPLQASRVILATGAWTNRLVAIDHAASASGQPLGFIRLTPEEAQKLAGMPVVINLHLGFFIFPPTPGSNILKIARHCYGFATDVPVVGTSRRVSSPKRDGNGVDASYLPDDAEAALREGLSHLAPEFANHKWMNRRLCWYTDTPEGDFVVDNDPNTKGLFLATAGAGQ